MIKTIATCLALAASPSVVLAQSGSLDRDSRQELDRVYGTTPPVATPPATHSLTMNTFRARLASGSAVHTFASLNDAATPETVNSLALLDLLDKTTGVPRYFLLWHKIGLDAVAVDHAVYPGAMERGHEQFGPPRSARALAILHLAMFEVANVLADRPYVSAVDGMGTLDKTGASADAAIIQTAYQIMTWLYPGLDARAALPIVAADAPALTPCDNRLLLSLSAYRDCSLQRVALTEPQAQIDTGISLGNVVAALVIAKRLRDGSDKVEPTFDAPIPARVDPDNTDPAARWAMDPVTLLKTQVGGRWSSVNTFAAYPDGLEKTTWPAQSPYTTFLKPLPGAATDPARLRQLPSYSLVETYGRETRQPGPFVANHDGLFIAQFWAYDGTANLCAPARLYNQIALAGLDHIETIPADKTTTPLDTTATVDLARYFAIINTSMSDAAVTAWGAKFAYQFARPVTLIRAVDQAAPPGNDSAHPLWLPVGAQNTNSAQPFNTTPPFPSYPSGHAVFGGALFGTMRQFISPAATFDFRSDEFNGLNRDAFNYVRCAPDGEGQPPHDTTTPSPFCGARTLTVDCAERENADSRVFMGVHWLFDADDGIVMGNKVARQSFALFQRASAPDQSRTFSVDAAATRTGLRCGTTVRYPADWDDKAKSLPFTVTTID